MLLVDVNLLVFAHRPEGPHHERCRSWLDEARSGDEPLGLADLVLSGFLRVVTHPRIFREPTPVELAMAFTEVLRASPAAVTVHSTARTWSIFTRLIHSTMANGNHIPDAYLAALALDHNATFCTADRGFARFPGLRTLHP